MKNLENLTQFIVIFDKSVSDYKDMGVRETLWLIKQNAL